MKNKKWVKYLLCISIVVMVLIVCGRLIIGSKISNGERTKVYNKNINLKVGDKYYFEDNEVLEKENYSINNKGIIEIDKDGVLSAVEIGDTKVIVEDEHKNKIEYQINVKSNLEKIDLTHKNMSITEGEMVPVQYSLYPLDSKVSGISLKSDNENVVKILNNKLVGVSVGETVVTILSDNDVSNQLVVRVVPKTIDVVALKLNESKKEMYVGDKIKLDVTISPENATNKSISWSSTNPKVATVSKSGEIVAKKVGETTIVVQSKNNVKANCKIKVINVPVDSVTLNKKSYNAYVGYDFNLVATVEPKNAFDKSIVWSSSNTNIAEVKNGKVYGKNSGIVTITATSKNGKKSSCKVTMKSKTKNKKVIFFGDSITYGYNNTSKPYSWANYMDDETDFAKVVNTGIGGWFISNNRNMFLASLIDKYKNESYDYVILSGGTNDIGKKFDIGTYDKNNFSGNYDEKTFLGGLEKYIYDAKKTWPNAKFGYIITYETPLSSFNRRELSPTYYAEMKKVLAKWKIPYIDLYNGKNYLGKKYSDLLQVKTKTYLFDGLHLNKKGYKIISPDIYIWMNRL